MSGGVNALANLPLKTDSNGYLLVTIGGGTISPTLVLAGDGSNSAPSYGFTTHTNTGIYQPSANVLGMTFNGTQGATFGTFGISANGLFLNNAVQDAALDRSTTKTLRMSADGAGALLNGVIMASTAGLQNLNPTNGQAVTAFQTLTELTTIAAAATTDTTIQMPANSVVLAVSVFVTVIIPTAATFTVGDSGSAARFSTAAVAVAAGSNDPGTKAGAYYNASALSIRITPNATPGANTGRVRVVIWYYTATPPTS